MPTVGGTIPRQVVLGCVRKLAKHEPGNEQARQQASKPSSSMVSALSPTLTFFGDRL